MLIANNLSHTYSGGTQISFPDISISQGDHWLISGASGCGKSTLLNILSGLLKPTEGSIKFNDIELAGAPQQKLDELRRDNIGFIFQDNHLVPSLNVTENLELTGATKSDITDQLEAFNLLDKAKSKPQALSRGEQQRICIIRGISGAPKVIFADEPTSSLDDKNTLLVIDLLKEKSKETGAALVVVSHDNRIKSNFEKTIQL